MPAPGPATNAPYAPTPILPGGVVVPLYPAGSPYLNAKRVNEPEQYTMSQSVPGRINSIINIHNPSIEIHLVDRTLKRRRVIICRRRRPQHAERWKRSCGLRPILL